MKTREQRVRLDPKAGLKPRCRSTDRKKLQWTLSPDFRPRRLGHCGARPEEENGHRESLQPPGNNGNAP
ncbi:hypothetical protein MTO96_039257, partial [Rhipicephalus appendiculatus]